MKTDLATAILAGIGGFIVGFFIINFLDFGLVPSAADFKTVENEVGTELSMPSEEIFNEKALNPTVEVYVGGDSVNTGEDTVDEDAEENTDGPTD